jgi:excinuclease UvrABC ATPase subunit
MKKIRIHNAHLHNLKNIDVELPTDKLIAISGVSGSGKSTLAFDILFEAGKRSYLQALGALASLGDEYGYDEISGLLPTVAVKQGIVRRSNPRSVVGTKTRLLNYLATLYADHHNRNSDDTITASQLSFNSPLGMCLSCQGRGIRFELDFSVLLPTPDTTLHELYQHALAESTFAKRIERLQSKLQLDPATAFTSLDDGVQQLVLYGKPYNGIKLSPLFSFLRYKHTHGKPVNGAIVARTCSDCDGHRIGEEARGIVLNGKHLGQLGKMTIAELDDHLKNTAAKLARGKRTGVTASQLLEQSRAITAQLIAVKLDYLSAYRPVPSLSGGEIQRLFLMSHLRADIAPLLYIFDEPTAGLHELEKQQLIDRLKSLSKTGNTVIVVEHDRQTLQAADHIVDMGPLAGWQGGQIVAQGKASALKKSNSSLTGQHLANKLEPLTQYRSRATDRHTPSLTLEGVSTNNLKQVTVTIPLARMVGVAGISGSGKSSLIADTLVPALTQSLNAEPTPEDEQPAPSTGDPNEAGELNLAQSTAVYTLLTGTRQLDKCIEVSQAPIGRRANSTVVTYLGIWDRIRRCFAGTNQAKAAGFTASHFSFNAAGACQQCSGSGLNQLWLGGSLVSYPCDQCEGLRYQQDILNVHYQDKTITDALAMTVDEACKLFVDDRPISRMLDVMVRTGMDYITLGQPTNTLSGGEAQRIKLARELGRQRQTLRCLYILDEPTTGLSHYDICKLVALLQELVSNGSSVIVVEHDPAVLSCCDWLIELGPGGGNRGGKVIATGPPARLQQSKKSLIAPYLQRASS